MRALDRMPAVALAIAAIVCVQFGNAAGRQFFEQTGPLGAAALRLLFGSLILLAIVRPDVRGWSRRTWLTVIGLGIALGGMNSLIYLAIDVIPIGVAVTVEFIGPLLVAVAQVRRWQDAAWALLALAGVVLLGFESGADLPVIGLVLAVTAALFWAGYIVLSARLGSLAHGLDPLAVAMAVAAVVIVPIGAPSAVGALVAAPWLALVFVAVAVVTSVLPYSLEFAALRRMPTRVFGILSSGGPAVAALAGLLVLGQRLGWQQIVALVLVTVASVGVTATARRPPRAPVLD